MNNSLNPQIVKISNVTHTSCGTSFSLVLTSFGSIFSFGLNEYGQLGTGDNTIRISPYNITFLSESFITQIETGDSHSLVLTSNGIAYSFGNNNVLLHFKK